MPGSAAIESLRPKQSLRDLAVIGFALTFAVLVVGLVLGSVNLRRLSENEREVAHTHEVIGQLETVLSTLTDAETGQRGYLLAEDEKYLQPYDEALRRLDGTVAQLKRLTSDNSEQQARLAQLEEKIAAKRDELKRTVGLMKARDRPAALQIVRSDQGKALMDDVRHAVTLMRQTEEDLLPRRADESDRSFWTAVLSVVLPGLLGIMLLGVAFYFNRRNLLIPA